MTNLAGQPRWYVVQTHAHAEANAVSHLHRQGFKTYLPRYLKRRSHARRVDLVSAPLFPGYLFVAIDTAAQRWRSINATFGVTRIVCHGEQPAAVVGAVVDELKSREDERGYIQLPPKSQFVQGEAVCVSDGLFSSQRGLFDGMANGQRVAVLLDLLGRKVRVIMDAELLAPA